ncbi:MAG: PDZ domain-containing protein [Coprobacter sp.]|nr:PDZ domain-containing protein [Coprobacter sp.]
MKRNFLFRQFPVWLAGLIFASTAWADEPRKRDFDVAKNLEIFNALYKELNLFYVDTIDTEKNMNTGIQAMLNRLDPYTVYIPESEQEDFRFMTTGEYGGIGSLILSREKNTYISEPYEGLPAQLAGLKAGDKLVKIDDEPLEGLSSSQVSDRLKGPANTVVKVTVERPGTDGLQTYDIVRKKITLPSVPYFGIVGDSIGYIYLNSFTDKAASEVKTALLELKKQNIKGLIFDLRGNGGGILDEAIQIVNYFVPKGKELLSTRGKIKQWDRTYKTTQEPIAPDLPLAVLVNSNSASASEIVAGSLQDLDRAVIIGERTYGKGLVQSTRSLPYNGTLKVTTAKYYIPSGRLIQAIDYSHRNPDGSVGRIPDSLTTAYRTANGRIVRDGGGINPDIVMTADSADRKGNIGFYLLNDLLFFDFATAYAQEHPTIAPVEEFALTDEEFEAFKSFVKSKDFSYDKQSEKVLQELKTIARFEGYLEDATEEFEALEKKLNHNLDKDLNLAREDIEELLSIEIVKRYYYQKGEIVQSLKYDRDTEKAVEILQNPAEYRRMLSVVPDAVPDKKGRK